VRRWFNLLTFYADWSWRKGAVVKDPVADLGLRTARMLVEATDDEWPVYVDDLRRSKELSAVTREINQLLNHPEYRQLAIAAFKRIGLWHDDLVMPRRMKVREFGGQAEVGEAEVPTQDRLNDEMSHLLELDEPMAAAGAQISGLHVRSETEEALRRTTECVRPTKQ
jgi:hypothetical protein